MKKIAIIMGMAFAGLTASAFAITPSIGVHAEGEEAISSTIEVSESATESLESLESLESSEVVSTEESSSVADPMQDLKDKVAELKAQYAEFQKTQIYTIVVNAVLICYTAYSVIKGILDSKTAKNIQSSSVSLEGSATKTDEALNELKELASKIENDYGKSQSNLAEVKSSLESAIKALEEATDETTAMQKKYENLEKAFLVLCQNDEELVKSGAYKKVLNTINGVSEDGE